MLGNATFRVFARDPALEVFGTFRREEDLPLLSTAGGARLISGVDVLNQDALGSALRQSRPQVVINCTGLIKQLVEANDPRVILPINAIFPHRLSDLCDLIGARLIQLSSDCVYSGRRGGYMETDLSDAEDLYGKSKCIGEIRHQHHVITIRTSGIGNELKSNNGLLEWFLSQRGQVKGYTKAIYSGLPSVEVARVLKDYILPRPELSGLYHVSSKPISKYDLLNIVSETFNFDIRIVPDSSVVIDRSLNSNRFKEVTSYISPEWPDLIKLMYENRW